MEFTGVIKQITTFKRDNGVIFYVSSKDAKAPRDEYGRVKCFCAKRMLYQGLSARFVGEFDDGFIRISSIKPIFINEAYTINYLTKRLKGTGIKKLTVSKIVDKYGSKVFSFSKEEFLNALNEDFSVLGVTINLIISELYDAKPIDILSEYLEQFSCEESVIRHIYETYGNDAINEIKKNPYNVCITMELPFPLADIIASKEGIDGKDLRRIEGYIRYMLEKHQKNTGDTYEYASLILEKVLNEFERRHIVYDGVKIHSIDVANALLESQLFIITDDGKLSFKKLYRAEETIATRIKALLNTECEKLDITDSDINAIEYDMGITLGSEQREAFDLLNGPAVSILTGGAGVGKTVTINAIVKAYKMKTKTDGVVVFCAPTGRAAKRLSQSIHPYKASTMHHALEIYPGIKKEEVTKNQNDPLCGNFFIADETSMADVELMSYFLLAIKNGARVLFVGDENQLPSVSPGNVLYDFIHSGIIPVYRLTKTFRQSDTSGIFVNGKRVLTGKTLLDKYDDFEIKEFEEEKDARNDFYKLVDSLYDNDHPYSVQIIEPMNKNVDETNLHLNNLLFNTNRVNLGSKIMFKLNGSNLEYVNGEFGQITAITKDMVTILNEDNVYKTISADCLYETLKLAYSVTIHKMQGSENDTIIIYLGQGAAHMMNRQLLYTAITRGRKKVIIYSVDDAIEDCVKKEARIRQTRLIQMLTA